MPLGRTSPDGSIAALPPGDWEKINATLERIAVPGGWLYRSRLHSNHAPMAFVPAPAIAAAGRAP
jgi:hypothetical protein